MYVLTPNHGHLFNPFGNVSFSESQQKNGKNLKKWKSTSFCCVPEGTLSKISQDTPF